MPNEAMALKSPAQGWPKLCSQSLWTKTKSCVMSVSMADEMERHIYPTLKHLHIATGADI